MQASHNLSKQQLLPSVAMSSHLSAASSRQHLPHGTLPKLRTLKANALTPKFQPHRRPSCSRVHMTAATASPSAPSSPCLWETMMESMGNGAKEADAIRLCVSAHIQEAVDTSIGSLKASTAKIPSQFVGLSEVVQGRMEVIAFESWRQASRLDLKYKIAERAGTCVALARLFADDLDCRYQIRQRFSQMRWELWYYLRKLSCSWNSLQRCSIFPCIAGAVFGWMLVTGLLRTLVLSTIWLVPFLPVIARVAAGASLVEGRCQGCGQFFIGRRKAKLSCRRCNAVVWRPRETSRRGPPTSPESGPLIVVDVTPVGPMA